MRRDKTRPNLRSDAPQRAKGSRSVGNAAPLIAVALLAITLASTWWVYQSIRRAQIEARYAEAAQAVARKDTEMKAAYQKQLAARRLAALGEASAAEQAHREQIVDDLDGRLLWASPTQGTAISLAYVPSGTLCLVYLRPAQLSAHPEGEKVLAALGPWGARARTQFETLAGAKLDEIDAALISLVVARDGSIEATLRIKPIAPWDEAELARRFPEAREQTQGEQTYLVDGKRAWFLAPGDGAGTPGILVACPASLVEELIASEGDAPLLARDIEALVAASDAERSATAIVGAKFLAASGTHLMEGEAEPLRDSIAALLGNDATAASLSVHWGDAFFVELRAAPALTVPSRWLATTLRTRVAEGATNLDAAIDAERWSEYGRGVLTKFPTMVEKLAQMSRRGEADKQAVVRAYLPAPAGHNLLMGAELLLTQAQYNDAQHAHADVGMAPQKEGGATIDQRLAKVTSLTFPKETLQRALELLAEDVGAAIEIDGAALRAEGITQNQSFALAERDKSAGEILIAILQRANPDRTATGPGDPRQKLVYVIDSTAAGEGRMIVTTRAAAGESGRALPPVFGGDGE
jgi:hypothetical protein